MNNINRLEAYYKKCIPHLTDLLPEGILEVDLPILQQLDLLEFDAEADQDPDENDALTRYFNVVESDEKITLINDQFVIWIVPESDGVVASTYTLIALNNKPEPRLETAFVVSGPYNTSRLVLRVLESLLKEIQENESELSRLKND